MIVSIDREHMLLIHKHDDHMTVSKLASIELSHVACVVTPVESDWDRCFSSFTDLELKLLHKNITGEDFHGYSRPHLVAACVELARRAPYTECNPFEVDMQFRSIKEDDDGRYAYVKGSMKPRPVDELFELAPQRVPMLSADELRGLKVHAQRTSAGATAGASTPAATTPAPQQRSRPVAPATPTAPRGGQRTIIWEAADKAWEAAGKPTSQPVILKLRKQIMDDLEKQGVKRTSCSSELGNWQKARCG